MKVNNTNIGLSRDSDYSTMDGQNAEEDPSFREGV